MRKSSGCQRIAVITPFAGVVKRGAERTADDFQRMLSGEVYVISLAGCRPPGGHFPELEQAKRQYSLISRRFSWLNWVGHHVFRGKAHYFLRTYDLISTNQLLDYSLSRRLPGILDQLAPQAVIALAGFQSHRVLSHYCKQKSIVLTGIFGGGPGVAMRIMARTLNQGIVVNTPQEVQMIRNTDPKIKSMLIPLGVDVNRFCPASVCDIQMPELDVLERPIFFSASALEPYKRLDLLIDAVSLLNTGSLVIASDGPLRAELLRQAGQKLGPGRFHYAGLVSDEMLVKLHQTADVYCLPSRNEAFGNVLLEALACGKPVVATDDPTRRWIVRDAGIVVDVTDHDAFAHALRRAASIDWGEKPRRRAQFFSLENVAAAWDDLIAAALEGKGDYISAYERELSTSSLDPGSPSRQLA